MRKINRHIVYIALYAVWVSGIIWLVGGCQSTAAPLSAEEQARLDNLVENREFVFDAKYAMPLSSQAYISAANMGFTMARGNSPTNINLTGDGYYLRMYGDSVEIYLPYFGTRENITNYNNQGSIDIKAAIEEFRERRTPKGHEMEFFAREGYERFRLILNIFPNSQSQLSVFSPQRDVIRYSGRVANKPAKD